MLEMHHTQNQLEKKSNDRISTKNSNSWFEKKIDGKKIALECIRED